MGILGCWQGALTDGKDLLLARNLLLAIRNVDCSQETTGNRHGRGSSGLGLLARWRILHGEGRNGHVAERVRVFVLLDVVSDIPNRQSTTNQCRPSLVYLLLSLVGSKTGYNVASELATRLLQRKAAVLRAL